MLPLNLKMSRNESDIGGDFSSATMNYVTGGTMVPLRGRAQFPIFEAGHSHECVADDDKRDKKES